MRGILLRLINHLFYMLLWLFAGMLLVISLFYLIFSNILNFSDSWNTVHPSLQVINDTFFKVIISILRNIENSLGVPNYLTRVISSFDYGHGYAIFQSIVTFVFETIMAWSGWILLDMRHQERHIREHIQSFGEDDRNNARTLLNTSLHKRRYRSIFIIFLFITCLIWGFDFYLTYAKQVIVSEQGGGDFRFALVGPLGTILLMTAMSLGFAWITEEIRREFVEITSILIDFAEHLVGQPQQAQVVQVEMALEGQRQELTQGTQPSEQRVQPPSLSAPIDTVQVWGVDGPSNISLNELNGQWTRGEIRIDGRVFNSGDTELTNLVRELFEALNPPGNDGRRWFYTVEGRTNLFETGQGEHGENNLIVFVRRG